ncbi:MAG: hypothetical protein JNJ88_04775 [Planctomycetes bacterium]|nr:hypothetical protein [Planctomycetota bacterium]
MIMHLSTALLLAPTVAVNTGDFDNNGTTDVRVVGTSGIDRIQIDDNLTTGAVTISVDANGDGDFLDPGDVNANSVGNVETIEVLAGNGNDVVTYQVTGAGTRNRRIVIDGGGGNDTITGTGSAATLQLGGYTIDAIGGAGNDILNWAAPGNDNALYAFKWNAGVGNDTGSVTLFSSVFGGTVEIEGTLGTGTNQFTVEIGGNVGLSSEPTDLRIRCEGGKQTDTVVVRYTNNLNSASMALVDVNLGAGNDVFRAEFDHSTFDLQGAAANVIPRFRIHAAGGDGNDNLSVSNEIFGQASTGVVLLEGILDIDLEGGLGNDELSVSLGDQDLDAFTAAGFRAGVVLRMAGGEGNDTLNAAWSFANGSTGILDAAMFGGLGNDTFNVNVTKPVGVTLYPLVQWIVDGGAGTDTFIPNGNVTFARRAIENNQ